jgi:putative membrane protein
MSTASSHDNTLRLGLALLCLLLLILSGLSPYDHRIWLMEVAPVLIALPLLVATHHRFPLTPLVCWLIFLHAQVLMLGGHYTYARVPLGFWVQDWLDLSRNHYDRLGHLMQGFAPAIVVREILLRRSPLQPGKWLFFLTTSVCLAISALYELIEWAAAITLGQGADEFLATQGDIWDTQMDMFCALIGALLALILLTRWHDRQLQRLAATA